MLKVEPMDQAIGARIYGVDVSRPMSDETFTQVLAALGKHGYICFPGQTLQAGELRAFAGRFGTLEINVAGSFQEPGIPEVMILSNIVEDGKPIGIADAGQDWHTDMSYSAMISFVNVLYGIRIPVRDGHPLGGTSFADMYGAYDDLPQDIKDRLETLTATHDFNKFWEMMRREKGSTRPPLTPEQRAKKPPVVHPLVLIHPITGRKVLYANPGYTERINELEKAESDALLAFLFKHQLQPKYQATHRWTPGDVLVWDNICTIHNAVADYRPDEPRLIKRCQAMADVILHSDSAKTTGAEKRFFEHQ
ncbi:MAG: TauD/TfdA family dioxygenase [Rhodobacter sp.]|nr:TauD/TfdA family dioxygenase [Paracoccaceae bacterium]MCC0077273.1 TauD/TfdA family dioxygenase [Rhodobacter sp.]